MKKLINTIFVLSIFVLITSCAKIQIVDVDKDNNTRTIKLIYDNGDTKIVNQKLDLNSGSWFEVECFDKSFVLFKDCPANKVVFTKLEKIKIAQSEHMANKSSNNRQVASHKKQVSHSTQQQSSNNNEEDNNEQDNNEQDNNEEVDNFISQFVREHGRPPLPSELCVGGPDVC